MSTSLRRIYRSIGKSFASDRKACQELLAGLKRTSATPNLASMFHESLETNAEFDGTTQPFLDETSLKTRTSLGPGSRGDNRIVYLLSSKPHVTVSNGPRGYSYQYVGRQLPPFRMAGVGKPRSGAGGIDYTARTPTNPVLGEIKRSGDKNAFYAFIQLLTYLSEMATEKQIRRAVKHKTFGMKMSYPQRFDLHILLADLNKRSATLGLIEPTRELAEAFRARLSKQDEKVLGKILCLQMDSEAFAEDSKPSLHCDWVA